MKITFVLDKQTIRRTDSNTVVAGSRDYLYAHFALASPDWIAPITAIFGNKTVILNDDGDCKVPWEVIEHPGEFSVSAFCVSVHTAQGVMVPVEETPYDPGETPPDPSPDVYTQLTQMVQEALDTANSVREDANAGEFNGAPGPVGPYYEPAVNDAGDISWENNGGLSNPPTKNIKGPKGDAATIEIAGTETGNPGTDASVVNEGTKGDAKLRFTIPRGDEGKAATIEVGEVTASDPGSEPRVTNAGTENAAVLDFVLPRGQTGPTGPAATIEVESTVTGEPGTQASVENVGTTGAAKLRFTIPRGNTGQNGVTPTLSAGNVETLEPDQPATASVTGAGPEYQINLGIPRGQTGAQGTPGQNGEDGQTPTISVGTVTTLDPGQEATAEITGKTPSLTLNLGIPEGQPGQDGVQINDEAVNTTETWSSKKLLDTICPPFAETGNPVTCHPVEGYPLSAVVTLEPKQAGTGDPSPENVRPISGYDSVKVNVRGKNVFDSAVVLLGNEKGINLSFNAETQTFTMDGTATLSSSSYFMSYLENLIPTSESMTVTVVKVGGSITIPDEQIALVYFGKGDEYGQSQNSLLNVTLAGGARTATNINDKKYLTRFWFYLTDGIVCDELKFKIQVEYGNTPTPYEPYQPGTTATLNLPETIYGGTVDAVTGVGSKTWGYIASYNGESLPGEWISDRDVYSSGTTPTTGAQVAYKLATPEPFQATGNQPLPAVAGLNTVYTDGDSVAVSGRSDPLSTIQTMQAQITALQDQATQGGTA